MSEDASRPGHVGNRCYGCHRAVSACWCAQVTPVDSPIKVVFLQHPREARNAIGTLHMAYQALADSRLFVGLDFCRDQDVQALLADDTRRHALLYPGPDAADAGELNVDSGALTLWVVDGTWWQARKVFQNNPWLQSLPRYHLQPAQPGQYRIRKEPAPHCLSTVEAVAALLETLERAPGRYATLLDPFHAMVEHQLAFGQSRLSVPWRRTRKRPRRLMRTLEQLGDDDSRVILVHGEDSGWPARAIGTPPAELLQWTAVRASGGAPFDAFVKPAHGVSDRAFQHQGLTPERLEEAITVEELEQRWAAWLRPQDRWCSWGFHAVTLLKKLGIPVPAVTDLRVATCGHLRARVGMVEDGHRELALPAQQPLAPGRGGMRLAQMRAIFEEIRRRENPGAGVVRKVIENKELGTGNPE